MFLGVIFLLIAIPWEEINLERGEGQNLIIYISILLPAHRDLHDCPRLKVVMHEESPIRHRS